MRDHDHHETVLHDEDHEGHCAAYEVRGDCRLVGLLDPEVGEHAVVLQQNLPDYLFEFYFPYNVLFKLSVGGEYPKRCASTYCIILPRVFLRETSRYVDSTYTSVQLQRIVRLRWS